MKWEYKIEKEISRYSLCRDGQYEWELIGFIDSDFYFKRPLKSKLQLKIEGYLRKLEFNLKMMINPSFRNSIKQIENKFNIK